MKKYSYNAIVTDGLWRKSISTIRALGKAGFSVSVMGDTVFTTGFWSRFTNKKIIAALAKNNESQFENALKNELAQYGTHNKPVIFFMEDASIVWASNNADYLNKRAYVLLPPSESLEIAENKSKTMQIAEKLDISCPKTYTPKDFSQFMKILNSLNKANFIIKPQTASGSMGIVYNNKSNDEWEEHWKIYGPLLIQEKIPKGGKGQGVSILFDDSSNVVAVFSHERVYEYPASGGPSTDRISISAPKIEEMSIRLLKKLRWKGIAMVEWKIDSRDNKPKLMEINPRFWGSLELAVRSGVNFPVLYAKAAMHKEIEKVSKYKLGVRCRWLIPGDILRYLTINKTKRESVREFLKGLPQLSEEWDIEDISGFLATLICSFVLALNPKYWKFLKRN